MERAWRAGPQGRKGLPDRQIRRIDSEGQPRRYGSGRQRRRGKRQAALCQGGLCLQRRAGGRFCIDPPEPRPDLTTRLAHADAFIEATGAEFREGGFRAFYPASWTRRQRRLHPNAAALAFHWNRNLDAHRSLRKHEAARTWTLERSPASPQSRIRQALRRRTSFEELVAELTAASISVPSLRSPTRPEPITRNILRTGSKR